MLEGSPFVGEVILRLVEDLMEKLLIIILELNDELEALVHECEERVVVAFPEELDIIVVDLDPKEHVNSACCIHVLMLQVFEYGFPKMRENESFGKEPETVIACVYLHLHDALWMREHLVLEEPDLGVLPLTYIARRICMLWIQLQNFKVSRNQVVLRRQVEPVRFALNIWLLDCSQEVSLDRLFAIARQHVWLLPNSNVLERF